MILFFDNRENIIFAVETQKQLSSSDINKLSWLFGNSSLIDSDIIKNTYLGPRAVMVSPWSTNAVEITQNMGVNHINRIEKYVLSPGKNGVRQQRCPTIVSIKNSNIMTTPSSTL